MTSRTTKQAARAYQKAHKVPYAEALRRVMEAETPPAEPAAHEHIAGGPGVGKGPFVGTPIKPTFEPVRFDPMTWLETAEQFDGEGSDAVHFSVTGQLGSGTTAGAQPRQTIKFGTVAGRDISSLLAPGLSHPVSWSPWKAQFEDRPPNVGIYGPHGHGKTTFLATLANRLKNDMPITVLTPFPETYPESQGKLKVIPFDQDYPTASDPYRLMHSARYLIGTATQWADEVDPEHVAAGRLPLLFLDLQPEQTEHVHDLLQLLRTSSHAGLGIFYIGPDQKTRDDDLQHLTDLTLYLNRNHGNWIARNGEPPLRLTKLFPPEEAFTGRY
jgi:hypothetical protein